MSSDEKRAGALPTKGKLKIEVDFDKRKSRIGGGDWQGLPEDEDRAPRCMRSRAPGHYDHCHWHVYIFGWVDVIYLGSTEAEATCADPGSCPY